MKNFLKTSYVHSIALGPDFSPRLDGAAASSGLNRLRKNSPARITTPSLGAPPLLNQEGGCLKCSPPQMRRRGAPRDGVVLNRSGVDHDSASGFFLSLISPERAALKSGATLKSGQH
jgi:hypothetical protein